MSIQAINVRNQFRGKVAAIIEGPVVSEVDVETRPALSPRSSPRAQSAISASRWAAKSLRWSRPPRCPLPSCKVPRAVCAWPTI